MRASVSVGGGGGNARDYEFEATRCLESVMAAGRTAGNDPRRWPRLSGDQAPDPPLLYQSSSGPDGGHVWLWGLPPPGPLTFASEWPAEQIPASQAQLDAGLLLAAAQRARTLWPNEGRP